VAGDGRLGRTRRADRLKRPALAALTVLAAVAALILGGLPAQAVDDVGFVGPVYGTSTTAPTGQKPQSKLWVADGIWWGALFDQLSRDFHIFRYDRAASTWTDTGVLVDERTNIYMDTLWDGQHLYVVGAGANPATVSHALRVTRFSYSTATQTWTRDSGYPVTPIGTGGVKSPVVDKDSTGMLWVTFFTGSKIWVSHSLPGDDRTWVPRYQLPTPADQSSVGADDLSALVAFDGDKIGVLWSNQLSTSETMYWSWHQDGTSDQQWNLQVAYQQPEGADDHINLKSLVGDSAGRVFAVAKTSMDAASEPLINLLSLSLSGQWSSDVVWTQADDTTRAIVQIDRTNREVYAFAAAPCCAGGTIYYKKTSLDNPQFSPGLGTPFIHSAAHPEANNATSTKQTVSAATGLVVMASDDETRTYLYNRLDLGSTPPTDTTAPETTITSAPPASTGSTDASFELGSSEPGSTFACTLDGAPAQACTSPQAYTGLAAGSHTFTVAATDAAGNTDPTPATHTWVAGATTTTFSDDFSSGGFTAGGWQVQVGGGGSATVVSGAVRPADLAARLLSTTAKDSTASLRKSIPAQSDLVVEWDALVVSTGKQPIALTKLYSSSGRVLSLARNKSGALSLQDTTTTVPTSATVPMGQVVRLRLAVTSGTAGRVRLAVNGTEVFSAPMNVGTTAFNAVRLGDEAKRHEFDYRLDNVVMGR
jgi:hypothetical protein